MKKFAMLITVFVLMLVLPLGVSATGTEITGTCGDNLEWSFNEATGELTISGTGDMYDYDYINGGTDVNTPWYGYKDVITSAVIEYGVTGIGECAFAFCDELEDVQIAKTVSRIGMDAFYECSSLEEIALPRDITKIDDYTFYGCRFLEEIELPEKVSAIGSSAFEGCANLAAVSLSDAVSTIGVWAFKDCVSLEEINLPDGITTIDVCTFENCVSLAEIEIPASVNLVKERAFYGCSALSYVVMPENLYLVGKEAFIGCDDLASVYFMGNSPSLGGNSFEADITLYYDTATEGWLDAQVYDAAAGTWNGYALVAWDGVTLPQDTSLHFDLVNDFDYAGTKDTLPHFYGLKGVEIPIHEDAFKGDVVEHYEEYDFVDATLVAYVYDNGEITKPDNGNDEVETGEIVRLVNATYYHDELETIASVYYGEKVSVLLGNFESQPVQGEFTFGDIISGTDVACSANDDRVMADLRERRYTVYDNIDDVYDLVNGDVTARLLLLVNEDNEVLSAYVVYSETKPEVAVVLGYQAEGVDVDGNYADDAIDTVLVLTEKGREEFYNFGKSMPGELSALPQPGDWVQLIFDENERVEDISVLAAYDADAAAEAIAAGNTLLELDDVINYNGNSYKVDEEDLTIFAVYSKGDCADDEAGHYGWDCFASADVWDADEFWGESIKTAYYYAETSGNFITRLYLVDADGVSLESNPPGGVDAPSIGITNDYQDCRVNTNNYPGYFLIDGTKVYIKAGCFPGGVVDCYEDYDFVPPNVVLYYLEDGLFTMPDDGDTEVARGEIIRLISSTYYHDQLLTFAAGYYNTGVELVIGEITSLDNDVITFDDELTEETLTFTADDIDGADLRTRRYTVYDDIADLYEDIEGENCKVLMLVDEDDAVLAAYIGKWGMDAGEDDDDDGGHDPRISAVVRAYLGDNDYTGVSVISETGQKVEYDFAPGFEFSADLPELGDLVIVNLNDDEEVTALELRVAYDAAAAVELQGNGKLLQIGEDGKLVVGSDEYEVAEDAIIFAVYSDEECADDANHVHYAWSCFAAAEEVEAEDLFGLDIPVDYFWFNYDLNNKEQIHILYLVDAEVPEPEQSEIELGFVKNVKEFADGKKVVLMDGTKLPVDEKIEGDIDDFDKTDFPMLVLYMLDEGTLTMFHDEDTKVEAGEYIPLIGANGLLDGPNRSAKLWEAYFNDGNDYFVASGTDVDYEAQNGVLDLNGDISFDTDDLEIFDLTNNCSKISVEDTVSIMASKPDEYQLIIVAYESVRYKDENGDIFHGDEIAKLGCLVYAETEDDGDADEVPVTIKWVDENETPLPKPDFVKVILETKDSKISYEFTAAENWAHTFLVEDFDTSLDVDISYKGLPLFIEYVKIEKDRIDVTLTALTDNGDGSYNRRDITFVPVDRDDDDETDGLVRVWPLDEGTFVNDDGDVEFVPVDADSDGKVDYFVERPFNHEVEVVIIWDDADNCEGLRPETWEVELLQNGEYFRTGKDWELDGEDWLYLFNNLPYADKSAPYVYTAAIENVPEGYTATVDGTDIFLTHEVELLDIAGNIYWFDGENAKDERPQEVTVSLISGGKVLATAAATADNGWTYDLGEWPTMQNGSLANYGLSVEVDHYVAGLEDYDIYLSYGFYVEDFTGDGEADLILDEDGDGIYNGLDRETMLVFNVTGDNQAHIVECKKGVYRFLTGSLEIVPDIDGDGQADIVEENMTNGKGNGIYNTKGGLQLVADVTGDDRIDFVSDDDHDGIYLVIQQATFRMRRSVEPIQIVADIDGDGEVETVVDDNGDGIFEATVKDAEENDVVVQIIADINENDEVVKIEIVEEVDNSGIYTVVPQNAEDEVVMIIPDISGDAKVEPVVDENNDGIYTVSGVTDENNAEVKIIPSLDNSGKAEQVVDKDNSGIFTSKESGATVIPAVGEGAPKPVTKQENGTYKVDNEETVVIPVAGKGEVAEVADTNEDGAIVDTNGNTYVGTGEKFVEAEKQEDNTYVGKDDGLVYLPSEDGSFSSQQVDAPVIKPAGGTYANKITVTISCATKDALIYYTTDGSTPNSSATLYRGAFVLSNSAVVKAVAVKDTWEDSEITAAEFTVTVGGGENDDDDDDKDNSNNRPGRKPAAVTPVVDKPQVVYPQLDATSPRLSDVYTDVVRGQWYAEAIEFVLVNKLMTGVTETSFAPNEPLNRQVLVQALYNLEGQPEVTVGSKFADVDADNAYAKAVYWAAEHGIIFGITESNFGGDVTITREQMAAILYRYSAHKGYDLSVRGDLAAYADGAAASAYAAETLAWANGCKLINGHANGTIEPQGTATNAQVAQVVLNFCRMQSAK